MKYKVVSLIMIIPLVLMLCVFSAANIATLKVSIPVSSVTIFNEAHETINLAEGNELQIDAQVLPRNASNKGLLFASEEIQGQDYPSVEIDENGLIKASGNGLAKIIVITKDGAYKKSFILEVTSTLATNMSISLNTSEDIVVGDEFKVLGKIYPEEVLDKRIKFSSSNSSIVSIDEVTGECRALSSGNVTLTAVHENGLNGRLEKQIEVTVLPSLSSSLITFDGYQILSKKIYSSDFQALMEINFTKFYELGLILSDEDIILEYAENSVEEVILTQTNSSNGIYKYNIKINGINGDNFNLKAKLNYENVLNYTSEIALEKVVDLSEITAKINLDEYIKVKTNYNFKIDIYPQDLKNYELNVYFDNDNITLNKFSTNTYYLYATSAGKNKLNIDLIIDNEKIKTFTKDIEVLDPPTSIAFADYKEYGIENLLTIGNQKIVNDGYVEIRHTFGFTSPLLNLDYIEFSSSDESIAKFEGQELVILKEGKVTITATELQSALLGINRRASLDIRCVEGVEVETYNELVKATESNKQVVIKNDIMLGEELVKVDEETGARTLLKDPAECERILNSEIKQIETTSEWNYYKNNKDYNYQTPPLINYIIKFTNNCFGNGYTLNANNITNLVDATNSLYPFAKFRGPLDLVAIPNASVKAQDNICFIASDNVTINNIELVGADLLGKDSADLNQLNYIGTVLEVMGDNVKIVNSKIKNGRNCVRVYGKESGNYDKINVLIESCIISNAREFLIKMGTNAKVYGEFKDRDTINLANGINNPQIWEDCSPKIQGFEYLNNPNLTDEQYKTLVNTYKESAEYQALVKTNLTVKNCVLQTSGLFSIGIETSFAGPALDGGRYNSWDFSEYGWSQIAGTNYPTMLNLEGSVKIYDWKNITHIDSSTLIEGGMFDFDLSKMIENLYSEGDFTNIITEIDGEKYCHGGIVMYGGGKNYAIVNTSEMTTEELGNYSLSLDNLKSSLTSVLKYASGKEPFRIFMYDKFSNFDYNQQIEDLDPKTGTAYDDIGKYSL